MEADATDEQAASEEDGGVLPQFLLRREPILDQHRGLIGYRLRVLLTGDAEQDETAGQDAAQGATATPSVSQDALAAVPAPPTGAPDDATAPGDTPADAADEDAAAPAPEMDEASFALMRTAQSYGANGFLAYLPHWIDASPWLLSNVFLHTLPRNRSYLELTEDLEITEDLIKNLQKLAHSGLRFSIRGDLAASERGQALQPFCNVVSFDPKFSQKAEIFRQSYQHKQEKRLLMGANLPDKASMDNFLLLGFTMFEGTWPIPRAIRANLTPRQKTLLRLLALIMGEGEIPEIQACLQHDAELVQAMLDMVNTPIYGLEQEVASLNQAIMLLGRRNLQRWIQSLVYTESGQPTGYLSPFMIIALARAHLMDAVSRKAHPEQNIRADACFTTGVLSLMDQLFGGDMQDLLGYFHVDVPVRQALLGGAGILGADLRLAKLIFPSNGDDIEDAAPLLREIGLRATNIVPLIQEAFVWAHSLTRSAT